MMGTCSLLPAMPPLTEDVLGRMLIEGQKAAKFEGSAMGEWAAAVTAAFGSDGHSMPGG